VSEREAGPERQSSGPAREQVVIKDKRKIDMSGQAKDTEQSKADKSAPTMGQPAKSDEAETTTEAADTTATDAAPAEAAPVEGEVVDAKAPAGFAAEMESMRFELDERLRDLQRVTAEYANYRKRVERDRGLMAEQTVAMVVSSLLPILDDFDRAREHGDLTGPLGTVAEQLNAILAKLGLSGFGEPGDAFDPTRHEAVAHQTSAEVTEPTCVGIMRRGYLLGEKLLRPALVAVADPE
jgi:molecular chaperone GrpE